ncbi:MAG: YggS family pyridoxal phosphate-dependent enzyme [Ignavibacterium album]|uniref:YggS family pyridoxal phosphate-dependent enzyme n=1 Tax=Ignavibacterium album TaxID=591197 RepID=UPI0026EB6A74|nr:YggS family pyridoxal phosphate-dependent enzyme [Ignavibacterium album]MCX8106840.1 YggS family pyridoxal phosphate-dependent enzyme [Ignavibacterium album]
MIAENLAKLRDNIARKCLEVGRNPDEIKLIAVSKYFGVDAILEANRLGVNDFGENRAQELMLKYEKLGDKVIWHFIGTLQKNKVKYAVKAAEYIHSVDSIELLEEINKRASSLNKVQKILLEVKTSYEETKSGLTNEEEIFRIAELTKNYPNVNLVGLMTIAPLTDDENIIRKSFRDLRILKDKMNKSGINITELSMGMTSDYEIAVEEGSTMLRIGSAIFGERDYSKDWRQI